MKTPNSQKVIRKQVRIHSAEQTGKKVASKYNKVQLFLAKTIGVEVADNYQYAFKINYKGAMRLKANDIVINEQGYFFMVARESNRIAILISRDALSEKPKMYGKLILISNVKEQAKR